MVATQSPLATMDEYLAMSFEDGDRAFVNGEVWEINLGDRDHSAVQAAIGAFLFSQRRTLGLHCVPDVSAVLGRQPEGRILDRPPFLVVEILSPEDRASRMEERIDDYLRFGVPWIWVIDPTTGRGHVYHGGTRLLVEDGVYRTQNPDIEMRFSELFD